MSVSCAWQVLLVGGASGGGKTRVSYPLARHYGVGVTDMDDFQVMLERMTTPEQQPVLHYWRTDTDPHPSHEGDAMAAALFGDAVGVGGTGVAVGGARVGVGGTGVTVGGTCVGATGVEVATAAVEMAADDAPNRAVLVADDGRFVAAETAATDDEVPDPPFAADATSTTPKKAVMTALIHIFQVRKIHIRTRPAGKNRTSKTMVNQVALN